MERRQTGFGVPPGSEAAGPRLCSHAPWHRAAPCLYAYTRRTCAHTQHTMRTLQRTCGAHPTLTAWALSDLDSGLKLGLACPCSCAVGPHSPSLLTPGPHAETSSSSDVSMSVQWGGVWTFAPEPRILGMRTSLGRPWWPGCGSACLPSCAPRVGLPHLPSKGPGDQGRLGLCCEGHSTWAPRTAGRAHGGQTLPSPACQASTHPSPKTATDSFQAVVQCPGRTAAQLSRRDAGEGAASKEPTPG